MNAEEIRKANELAQKVAEASTFFEAQNTALMSLACSMLAEIAAQLAEANDIAKKNHDVLVGTN
jgi:hypothetical protein